MRLPYTYTPVDVLADAPPIGARLPFRRRRSRRSRAVLPSTRLRRCGSRFPYSRRADVGARPGATSATLARDRDEVVAVDSRGTPWSPAPMETVRTPMRSVCHHGPCCSDANGDGGVFPLVAGDDLGRRGVGQSTAGSRPAGHGAWASRVRRPRRDYRRLVCLALRSGQATDEHGEEVQDGSREVDREAGAGCRVGQSDPRAHRGAGRYGHDRTPIVLAARRSIGSYRRCGQFVIEPDDEPRKELMSNRRTHTRRAPPARSRTER